MITKIFFLTVHFTKTALYKKALELNSKALYWLILGIVLYSSLIYRMGLRRLPKDIFLFPEVGSMPRSS